MNRKLLIVLVLFITLLYLFIHPQISIQAAVNHLVINEIGPKPSSGPDWVEIYNPTASDQSLNGWILADSSVTPLKTFGVSDTIAAGAWLAIDVSNRLNDGGDSAILKDNTSAVVDSFNYTGPLTSDTFFARIPDGEGTFVEQSTSTKGTANAQPTVTPTTGPTTIPTVEPTPSSIPPTPTNAPPTTTVTPLPPTSTPIPISPTSTPMPQVSITPSPAPTSQPTPTTRLRYYLRLPNFEWVCGERVIYFPERLNLPPLRIPFCRLTRV